MKKTRALDIRVSITGNPRLTYSAECLSDCASETHSTSNSVSVPTSTDSLGHRYKVYSFSSLALALYLILIIGVLVTYVKTFLQERI